MRTIRTLVLFHFLIISGMLQAQSWRSSLYSTTWSPQGNFYTDKIIQDFSYAGYHRGEKQIPVITTNVKDVTVSPYFADKTGASDATAKIQKAIDDVSAAGGGVVYLPAGTYKVSPGSNNYCLQIKTSNVVLRGAGQGKTFILNTSYQMQNKSILKVQGSANWYGTETNKTLIAKDLTGPTKDIPVKSSAGYVVGDIVILRNYIGDAWINEHKITQWLGYGSSLKGLTFCRQIMKVDPVNNIITIDAPIRYSLLTRDNSAVYKISGMISEVGIESLSVGNIQNPSTTGWGEEDYTNSTKAAYNSHASYAVYVSSVNNGWVNNVGTFQPSGNTSTAHLLSNGLLLNYCKNTTVQNCYFQRPQYGGGGGNGYMYRITGSENLMQLCTSEYTRHGFVFSSMCTSGNVIHKCTDIKTGTATGATGYYKTSGNGSDHHMHFSVSNLIDQCTTKDSYFAAGFRDYGSTPIHGITAAHSVYWNMTGNGTTYSQVVHTQQGRYGYAIGTSGNASAVKTGELSMAGSSAITAPVDHVEGVGTGATLVPQSLYLDQVSKRLNNPVPCLANQLPTISLAATASSLTAPANVTLTATALDTDGSITKVDFYSGPTLLNSDVSAPYSYSLTNVVAGNYSYTAKVIDNCGGITTSAISPIVVGSSGNKAPVVSITSPSNNASFNAPASITISASATDADGTISAVQFFNGATLLGSDATSPYSFVWSSVATGTYSITAKATDNSGAVATSTGVSVKVITVATGDIIGVDCGTKNTSGSYQLSASDKINATSYSWWYTGSVQSVTPVSTDNSKATVVFGSGFSAGNLCVGVNYNAAPWYKQYCKALAVCGARTDVSMLSVETTDASQFIIAPNPSNTSFLISSGEKIISLVIADCNGMIVHTNASIEEGESISVGDKFSPGLYFVKILYLSGRTEVKRIQKMM
jgi:hypothetical protein